MTFTAAVWTALYLASEWAVRIVMTIFVPFRRSADAARGWLLLVFFLPWPALLLYFFIGRPTYPQWRRERFERLPEVLALSSQPIEHLMPEIAHPAIAEPLAEAAAFVQRLGLLPVVGQSDAILMSDYQGVINRLVADIDAAREHVHLLFYIFANDSTGRRVIDALKRAAARGVECRILIDAIGSRPWSKSIKEELIPAGVNTRRLLPVGFLRRKSARADLRNHCKIAIIDGAIGYAGSQNIIDPDFAPGIVNQELMTRLTGPIVLELQTIFIANWFLETEEVLPVDKYMPQPVATGTVACQVLPSGPDYPGAGVEHLLVSLIHAARKRIVLTTPYFVPSESLLTALQTAVLRGAEVHLVVSEVTDHRLVKWAQCSYYDELMEAGIVIHTYRDKLLHAKHISIDDDLAVIGSSNVDIRSFVLNSEIMVIFYDSEIASRLHEEQKRYFANSDRLVPSVWRQRSWPVQIAENLARMLGPLL